MHDTTRTNSATKLPPGPRPSRATIDPTLTVNEVVRRHPVALRVFTAFGVEACCRGGTPLPQAALDANVPLDELLDALEGTIERDDSEDVV